MHISYDSYRIFYYVARYGSLSQAARLLLSSQPNLTRAIRSLEGELGCTLFLRTSRGMKLTPEGEALYAHIRVAAAHIEAAEEELGRSRGGGTVTVAASEMALRCFLLPVLRQFRISCPGIRLRVSNHSTRQAVTALRSGEADFAVVTTPLEESAALDVLPLRRLQETAICAPDNRALLGRTVPLAELTRWPLIALGSGTMSFALYSAFFSSCGLPYRPDIEAASADQILPMVEAGLGVGFLPEPLVSDRVRVIALAEPVPSRTVCLVRRKEQPLRVAARQLEEMILAARG